MSKSKREEKLVLFQNWNGRSCKGCRFKVLLFIEPVRNSSKAGNLYQKPKVGQFLESNTAYTKFSLATQEIKRMNAFDNFKIENCCMDHASVDKLAKEKNSVGCLLVP